MWLREWAIVKVKNIDVDAINLKIQQSLPVNKMSLKSIDIVIDPNQAVNYPIDDMNSLDSTMQLTIKK